MVLKKWSFLYFISFYMVQTHDDDDDDDDDDYDDDELF